jgi:hypothetical protein
VQELLVLLCPEMGQLAVLLLVVQVLLASHAAAAHVLLLWSLQRGCLL